MRCGDAWALSRPLGVGEMLAVARHGRTFSLQEQELLAYLAGQAATALENARFYAERSEIARTLATSLRPPALPRVDGWSTAALYRPAGRTHEVGGDFYDVFSVGDAWMVVIGDVTGKGPAAAALTGLARYSLRTGATLHASPAAALEHLNDDLHREDQNGIISALCVLLRERDGRAEATIACAGHPPPVHVHGGEPRTAGKPSLLLGVEPDARFVEETVSLADDDRLVLYTDGVLDAARGDERFGARRLLDAVRGTRGSADSTLSRLVERVESFQEGPQRDDIAMVVIQRSPAPVADGPGRLGPPLARRALG